jgi:hypothetical protein
MRRKIAACRRHPRHRYTSPMHFDAHQPVLDELEARITAIRDSL